MTDMYAVVARPGPVEASILSDISPIYTARRVPTESIALRTLETEGIDEPRGDRPPIVLLHGRGHAASIWFPLLPDLARLGPVLAVDLPGFGHSASLPFSPATTDPNLGLRFFVDPIEELLVKRGLKNPILVGHSLGGFISVELALRGVIRPSKILIIGGMGIGPEMRYPSRAFFRLTPERIARSFGPGAMKLIAPYAKTPVGERLAALEHELYSIRGGRPNATAAFNTLFPGIGPAFNRKERLGEITCPTLLLWGKDDAVFPPSIATAAAAAMRSATAQIEPLNHAPHLEDPARILPSVLDFLK